LAERRRDGRIGTEHVLLAAADASPFLDAETLKHELRRLDEDALRAVGIDPSLADIDPPRRRIKKQRHIPFTRDAKKVLEDALREALDAGDRHIDADHILLALTRLDPDDRAMRAMSGSDVDPMRLRESLLARRAS
ncbi:MAG: Clp protease N-terminal domain-containing protein, partial [Acidimicrobiia bacterium]